MSIRRREHPSLMLPIALSAIVILSAALSQSSIRDAVTGATPGAGMTLVLPTLYIALSPLSRALDTISLLSIAQHIGLGVVLVIVAALMRRQPKRFITLFAVTGVLYVCAAALPRPMAKLVVASPDVVLVDFHSHTNASGDARKDFSPEGNRAWHRNGGFNAAYVSDHRTFAGAVAALQSNPVLPGDDVVLLSAYEGRYRGTFEIFIGLTRDDSAALIDRRKHLRDGKLRSGLLPTSIVALPAPLSDVQAAGRDNPPHFVGIEVIDGSPRGLLQTDHDRRAIIERADSLGIALVSGGNNHGWGRVVPAWTLLRIPGWRSLAPDSLAASIESSLRASPRPVQVVERRRATLSSPLSVIGTLPVAAAIMLATLTMAERAVWLLWIWILWAAWRGVRSVRAS